jgi:formylglycine-generating enzyme required for sulfatase activity
LPTDAEWEIVARRGARTSYGFGSEVGLLDQFGWFEENSDKAVHPPKGLLPNGSGLFDLHGNLFEWTHDWDEGFDAALETDPLGPPRGSSRVNRGGSWNNTAANCRTANRNRNAPTNRNTNNGLRLAFNSADQRAIAKSSWTEQANFQPKRFHWNGWQNLNPRPRGAGSRLDDLSNAPRGLF